MAEPGSKTFETPERVPTLEEVHAVFKRLTNKEFAEVRRREDKKGLYLWEVTVPGEQPGEVVEYGYRRAGDYKEFQSSATQIDIIYLKDGEFISGTTAARFVNGTWKFF